LKSIRYSDENGRTYEDNISYAQGALQDYKVALCAQGMIVLWRDWARPVEPSSKYDLYIRTSHGVYSESTAISNAIDPHDVERIKVYVGADKSADVRVRVIVHYDDNKCLTSSPVDLHIDNPRKFSFLFREYEGTELFPEEDQRPRDKVMQVLRDSEAKQIFYFEF